MDRMQRIYLLSLAVFLASLFGLAPLAAAAPGDRLIVSGAFLNPQSKPVKEVKIEVLVDGQPVTPVGKETEIDSGSKGAFSAQFQLPPGTLPGARVEIQAHKPSWEPLDPTPLQLVDAGTDEQGNRLFETARNFTLRRAVTPAFWMATLILLVVYVIISFEWMHRTLAALLAAALILFITYTLGSFDKSFYILSFQDAMGAIDLNVIFLLLGMMIFVGVLKRTGMFQFLAYKAYAWARGNVFILAFVLQFLTAVISAFLDNVTTMLLVIPVTIEIALTLGVHPLTFLIPQAFASNVGGTATLIGDPPNILIGSYTGLTFGQFVTNLSLVCLICLIVSCFYYLWWHKKEYLKAEVKDLEGTIARLREEYQITDMKLMIKGLVLLGFTIMLFALHGFMHMQVSVAALIGSLLLLAVSRVDIVEMLEHEVEWPSLMFFIGLFVVIAAAEETGLIQQIANIVLAASQGNLTVAVVMILWVSAIASAFIDNIPFTATMLPIVLFLSESFGLPRDNVLWWSLSLGACLGGNGTMIGASANVVTVGMAEKAGYKISFVEYMKMCWWPMMITVTLSMVYLLMAY
ncbi:MAG: ArsB/NhaD family transporter [Syntrophobacteraceae bacterium]|jgi:Na+/H+ antiporter NhaD/arsenite permease-like protein|nr:ArsB/NhaD family transporter [Syntrophobacteraceae bacterium]